MSLSSSVVFTTTSRRWHLLANVVLVGLAAFQQRRVDGFSYPHQYQQQQPGWMYSSSSSLNMALTPVGPFCPFRSSAAMQFDSKMEKVQSAGPEFATEMARLQLDMQMGQTPDPDRLKKVADGLDEAVTNWEDLVSRLRLSQDFQTREYAKLTQAHLAAHNETIDDIASMMKWQANCMRAMADNTPPPMPPPEVDLAKLMEQAQQAAQSNGDSKSPSPPSLTAMTAAEQITETPFNGNEAAFDSPTVKEEYEQLCRDHMSLIEFGNKYDTFDPLGKIYYLDEIDKIHDRWDIFFTRFSLMGALNQKYVKQCEAFLQSMGMNEDEYRKLLEESHTMMRQEAEAQRV